MSIRDILNDQQKVIKITQAAFRALDNDDSGYLERSELQEIMSKAADALKISKPTNDEIDEVVKDLDKNQDGKLSVDEFQTLIESVLEIMAKMEEK